ncbi:hypothetical protein M2475_001097 [Breznakia sp. PF5-3]|uniref:hypothetical protein n=1 Tax=unclassified Breznakia TaxID=2623764 RepID=UPI0024059A35|nr:MULTISPECIES: hypothetical protein [unclassified Breznakia]MDF9824307.1 hypothetical protein [Breznakia sp. PM6-1]MDF9835531.1 hypothetical protein [Breznakia sp. PF5-3]MDF9838798.1 hypothetical protein [Breznakia sp. PFB2-8]MDF9860814.1 hypothetical protein [Breznakia sp. PH5-24]
MKKKLGIILLSGAFLFSGCSSEEKADKVMTCYMMTTVEDSTYTSLIEIEYNEDSKKVIKGSVDNNYTDLKKTDTNGSILQDLSELQTAHDAIEGVSVTLDVTESEFAYKEEWDYLALDMKEVLEADKDLERFISKDSFSLKKLKEVYTREGYSCTEEDKK